ncbi:VOC family protein [Chitinophagaceae bacterium MMS25-I14]
MQKMSKDTNILNWFEIPVSDIARAKKFYETIFDLGEMQLIDMMGSQMAFFPFDNMAGRVAGALVKGSLHKPSGDGAVVYMNGNPDLQQVLDRIEAAGGKIQLPKTLINQDTGYMAFFIDTEGNSIGLHSGQ